MANMYRVTAPYITVKVQGPLGTQVRGFSAGAILPQETADESIQHHVRKGMIEQMPVGPPAKFTEPPPSPQQEGGADPGPASGVQIADLSGAGSDTGSATGDDEPPPQSGRGSGRDAWADYAARHDVAVPDDATRDEIIAALRVAGVAVDPRGEG